MTTLSQDRVFLVARSTQNTPANRQALGDIIATYSNETSADEAKLFDNAYRFELIASPGTLFAYGIEFAVTEGMKDDLTDFWRNTMTGNRRAYQYTNVAYSGLIQQEQRSLFEGQMIRKYTNLASVETILDIDDLAITQWVSQPFGVDEAIAELAVEFLVQVMPYVEP